jgi:hypothetical protein
MNINKNVKQFIEGDGKNGGRNLNERYASFDFCYNYFQSFKERGCIEKMADKDNMQMSCLQLGFYLASWGMLRGSSFLLEKSIKHYEPLIRNIVKFDKQIWEIDADNYTEENINLLLKCRDMICKSLGDGNKLTDTLTTKIMLGVFSNVPAYDDFFRRGFEVYSFGEKSLRKIARFYNENKEVIDKYKIRTFDFPTGLETKREYTKAKIIDMICFVEGQNNPK